MKQTLKSAGKKVLALLGLAVMVQSVHAQTFVYTNGDLCLGFRKTGTHQEANEVVVDLGPAYSLVNLPAGTTSNLSAYTATQLAPGSFTNCNNLTWSVTSYLSPSNNTTYPGYWKNTIWVTVPRTSPGTQSTPPTREGYAVQQTSVTEISSIFLNAKQISQAIGTTNQYNTVNYVRESIAAYPTHILTDYIGGKVDPTQGTLQDTWEENNLEITTPASFTNPVVSDLYEVRPLTDASGNPVVDPHTGTNGPAYYVGYFTLNTNGTISFTRASSYTAPAAAHLAITQSGGNLNISFGTTSGAVYTLYGTNLSGLTTPVSKWPSVGSSITGNGGTTNFVVPISGSGAVYRVGAH